MTDTLPTDFAPAERAPAPVIESQARMFGKSSLLGLLDAVPTGLLVVNEFRQCVFCNASFRELCRNRSADDLVGLRPGEALNCIHASLTPGGCGTTEFCSECGAARAILSSLRGVPRTDECRIMRSDELGSEALDLQVFAAPFEAEETPLTLFTVLDISHEKRRQCLEHIFFHDILNLVTGLKYSVQLTREKPPGPQILARRLDMQAAALTQAAEEINMQKNLLHAEQGLLRVAPVKTDTHAILRDVIDIYSSHNAAADKSIELAEDSVSVPLTTDPVIAGRVLGNMIKNALEASSPGQTVLLESAPSASGAELRVHNPAVMSRSVQRQVFKRSFSTKGEGRGLGTYSIKLLTEQYLKGAAGFVSTEASGTVFFIRLPRVLEA